MSKIQNSDVKGTGDVTANSRLINTNKIYVTKTAEVLDDHIRKNDDTRTAPPAVTDDAAAGFSVGSRISDITNDLVYHCVDSTNGAAVWSSGGGGGGSALLVRDESNTVSDAAVTELRFPDEMIEIIAAGQMRIDPTAVISTKINQVADWVSFTPTGSWTTNTTYLGNYKRIGDTAIIQYNVNLSGAPNAAIFTINMPSGLTIDSSKLPSLGGSGAAVGRGMTQHGGRSEVAMLYAGTSGFTCRVPTSSGSFSDLGTDLNATTPATYANGHNIHLVTVALPILEWANTTPVVVTEADSVAPIRYTANSVTSISNNATTIINFALKDFDDDNLVTTGASWKWTAPRGGKISAMAHIRFADLTGASGEQISLQIFKGGGLDQKIDTFEIPAGTTSTWNANVSGVGLVDVAEGDEIDFRVFQNTGVTLSTLADVNNTHCAIHYIDKSPLIGLSTENHFGALIDNNGATASITTQGGNSIASVSRTGTGTVQVNFTASFFTVAPVVVVTCTNGSNRNACIQIIPSTTGVRIATEVTSTGAAIDDDFHIMIMRQGADYNA